MRVAVVDIGTNSTRLLVADVEDSRVSELERRSNYPVLSELLECAVDRHAADHVTQGDAQHDRQQP